MKSLIAIAVLASAIVRPVFAGPPAGRPARPSADAPSASQPASSPTTRPADRLLLGDADNGKSFSVQPGATISITLAANITTGYSWSVAKLDGQSVRAIGDVQYRPDAAPPGMVGSGGRAIATLEAIRTGRTTITLEYRRPWEKDVAAEKTYTVQINVVEAATRSTATRPAQSR